MLQPRVAGEIGRTALTFDAFLLFALPFLFTLAALVAELTDRSHQFARSRVALFFCGGFFAVSGVLVVAYAQRREYGA